MGVIRAHNNYAHTGLCIIKLIITRDVHNILTQQFETWVCFSFILSNLLLLFCFFVLMKSLKLCMILKSKHWLSTQTFVFHIKLICKLKFTIIHIRNWQFDFFYANIFFSLLAVHYVNKISVMCNKQEGCLIHFHFYTIKVWLVWNLNKCLFVCFFWNR